MFKNYSSNKTPTTSNNWRSISDEERKLKISNQLKENSKFKDFEVVKTPENGQIELKIETPLAANLRGDLLLDLEEFLTSRFCKLVF